MKKKQKINKAVNYGEWLLLGLTALFVCALFVLRERPAPSRGIAVRTASSRSPNALPASDPPPPDSASNGRSVPESAAPVSADAAAPNDGASNNAADSVPASDAVADSALESAAPDTSGLVNINTADAAQLCALPGVGEALAGRIVAYQEEHGPFARPEDVMRVSGIGEGKFSAIKGLIAV